MLDVGVRVLEYLDTCKSQNIVAGHISGMIATNPETEAQSRNQKCFISSCIISDLKFVDVPRGPPITVTLKKEGAGLGFSLEGGKDSPYGDRPMTIKKIFTGEFNRRSLGSEFNL